MRTSKTPVRQNRRTWRHAHTRPTADVPGSASVNAATRRLRNSRLSPGKNQHPDRNNQNCLEDRTGKIRESILPL
jgi:hypothetical protein